MKNAIVGLAIALIVAIVLWKSIFVFVLPITALLVFLIIAYAAYNYIMS